MDTSQQKLNEKPAPPVLEEHYGHSDIPDPRYVTTLVWCWYYTSTVMVPRRLLLARHLRT
ncbi:hypothetical protein KFL01_14660 [Kocuria flava]|uniref:Uncharacterized protein n=1 Tax=Kocuria flava TaxID=446860 RepID=A0ABQ0X4B0_9MICC|nr:hypothetical protein KFL01_14660 [Kocuria flava]